MPSRHVHPCARDPGFTLVEMLVSLAILVLLLALLPNALGLGRRAWESHEDVAASLAEQAGLVLIEQRLAEAMSVYDAGGADGPVIAFRGEAQSLVFVATWRGPAGPGLRRWTLRLEGEAGASASRVVLISEPQGPGQRLVDPADRLSTVIAQAPASFALDYFGVHTPGEPSAWHASWSRSDDLPLLVAVTLTPRRSASPTGRRRIVVALKLAVP